MDDAQGARERRRVTGVCVWLGFTLATLFLYPLAAALDSGIYYLQWQRRDLVETLTALASLTLLFAVALYVVWPLRGRRATIALLLVAAIPMMSFMVDRLVGDIVARMKRDGTFDDMTVVIFADHGFRFGGEERDPRHIPFIVKLPGQGSGEIVVEPHEGERLLLDVLRQSCKAAS